MSIKWLLPFHQFILHGKQRKCILLKLWYTVVMPFQIKYISQNMGICIISQLITKQKTFEDTSIETKTILCTLHISLQHMLNMFKSLKHFSQHFHVIWKILASHTRLWVRRKFPLKVLSLQNMNKKNSSRRVYIPIRVHLRQNRVHWKAEGKRRDRTKQKWDML